MDIVHQRACSRCKIVKPLSEFARSTLRTDGTYPSCKECNRARNRAYYQANRETVIARTMQYRNNHPEVAQKARVTFRIKHPEKVRETSRLSARKWREQNREKDRKNAREWAKKNPVKARLIKVRRRARARGSEGTFTPQEWEALKQAYGYRCLRCDRPEPEITLSIDHVIPLTKGGRSDISNIQSLCLSCNASKGNRHATDYRTQDRRQYYKQRRLIE